MDSDLFHFGTISDMFAGAASIRLPVNGLLKLQMKMETLKMKIEIKNKEMLIS